jgi:hypothetical protein
VWFAIGRGAEQLAGLAAKLVKVGTVGKLGQSVSSAARASRPSATRESCHKHDLVITVEVDSVLPANPAAPSDAISILPADATSAIGPPLAEPPYLYRVMRGRWFGLGIAAP